MIGQQVATNTLALLPTSTEIAAYLMETVAGGARLGDSGTADIRIAHQCGKPGGIIKPHLLGNSRAKDDTIKDIGRDSA